jgi:pSer/pThr/pTyr-binding forkhead associated (FHA) protein
MELSKAHPELTSLQPVVRRSPVTQPAVNVYLEGMTPQARNLLPEVPFRIMTFPFRIGRQSSDPLVHNDLSIPDIAPLQISRHHLAFIRHGSRIGVSDRGSRLGSLVDGKQLGGGNGHPGTLYFAREGGELVLGDHASPFKFKVTIRNN